MKAQRILAWLDDRQWLWLLLASPLLLFINPRWSPVLLVLPVLWGLAFLARRNPLPATPLNLPLLVLWVMVLVSLYATYDIAVSLPKIAGMELGLGAFFCTVRMSRRPQGFIRTVGFFLLLGLGAGLTGLLGVQKFTGKISLLDPLTARFPRLIAGLPGAAEGIHPNEVAGAILWVLPLAVALAAWGLAAVVRNLRLPGLRSGAAASALVTLLLAGILVITQSRGAYAALAVILMIDVLAGLPRVPRLAGGAILTLGLATSAYLLLSGAVSLSWIPQFLPASVSIGQTFSLGTLDARLEIWSRVLFAIRDFPITGMGMNTFRYVLPVLYPLANAGAGTDIGHAHNEFLQAALDLGIPGMVAFAGLQIGAVTLLAGAWRRLGGLAQEPRRFWRAVLLGLGGCLGAHFIYGLSDAVALGAKPGVLFWILLGLIYAAWRKVATPLETTPGRPPGRHP